VKIFDSFTSEVVELLNNGAVGVIPTDTVYGIVAKLEEPEAVGKIYFAKNRDPDKRVGTVLISDVIDVEHLLKPSQLLAAQVYWPAPVSVEMEVGQELNHAHRGHGTLAFRMPDHTLLSNLLRRTGPLASSSANIAEAKPAETIEEAMGYFRDNVDFYVKGGYLNAQNASRIIRINNDRSIEEIR
jgi:L-threonylcarbamoyladenylate synthase